MTTIVNNSNFILSIENQEAVRQAAANMYIDAVQIDEDFDPSDEDVVSVFETENEEGDTNFIFSLNVKTSKIV